MIVVDDDPSGLGPENTDLLVRPEPEREVKADGLARAIDAGL